MHCIKIDHYNACCDTDDISLSTPTRYTNYVLNDLLWVSIKILHCIGCAKCHEQRL